MMSDFMSEMYREKREFDREIERLIEAEKMTIRKSKISIDKQKIIMNTLNEDAEILLSFQAEYKRLNDYAIKCYNERYGTIGGLHLYKTFELVSKDEMKVIYTYVNGIIPMCEYFITEIV